MKKKMKKDKKEMRERKGKMWTSSGPGWSPNLPQKKEDKNVNEELAQHRIGSTVPDQRRKRKDEREK